MAQGERICVMDLLQSDSLVKISAPMVRYSKLAFRKLVRSYGCDICYTPMIVSNSFIQSSRARDVEFTTSSDDRPLIVQFAANNLSDFLEATKIVAPYCDGVDLNCGCPQRWASREGYGACLLQKPELVSDIVHQTRNAIPDKEFTVSVKTRVHTDIRKSVDFCRQMESAGVSYVTVHGRTKDQRREPVNLDAIRQIRESVNVPVVANGDVTSLEVAEKVQEETGVHGVMAARGLLRNPAMFSGSLYTPCSCIEEWVRVAISTGTPFTCLHHHLIYMMERCTSRADRRVFNVLSSTAGVIEFLTERYAMEF